MKFFRRLLTGGFFVAILVSCRGTITQPATRWYPDAPSSQFSPPSFYREVWDSTSRCVQQTIPLIGDSFDDLEWYEVDADTFWNGVEMSLAVFDPSGLPHRIYLGRIALRSENIKWVVAHESIHATTGIPNHPTNPFSRCVSPWWE